jgi:hypothetical protein
MNSDTVLPAVLQAQAGGSLVAFLTHPPANSLGLVFASLLQRAFQSEG